MVRQLRVEYFVLMVFPITAAFLWYGVAVGGPPPTIWDDGMDDCPIEYCGNQTAWGDDDDGNGNMTATTEITAVLHPNSSRPLGQTVHVGVSLSPTCLDSGCPDLHGLHEYMAGAQVKHMPSYESEYETAMAHARIINGAVLCVMLDMCDGFDAPKQPAGSHDVTIWYAPVAKLHHLLDVWITIVPTPHAHFMINAAHHQSVTAQGVPYIQLDGYRLWNDPHCREVRYAFESGVDPYQSYGQLLQYVAGNCIDADLRGLLDVRPTIELQKTPYAYEDSPAYAELQRWQDAAQNTGCQLEKCNYNEGWQP